MSAPLADEFHPEEPLRLERLHPLVVRRWQIAALGSTVAFAVSLLLLQRILGWPVSLAWVAAAVVPIGLVMTAVWPPARYRSWGYQVRERDLYVRRGVLSRTTTLIPHTRIQHVDTRQDVVERQLGLARVIVYTAGIRGAELTLPGLAAGDAAALRDQLAALSGEDHAV